MNKQNGFTLIELVVVIIILGILAVTAAPKFINLQSDARASTVDGVKAALQGANTLVHSKALIKGLGKSAGEEIVIGKNGATDIKVTADFGYLDSATSSAIVKANLEKALEMTFEGLASGTAATEDFGVVWKSDTSFIIVPKGKKDTDACRLEYTPSTGTSVLPKYLTVTTAC
ncbi:type II secretion system protein [Shewanella woodyi]|uniref:type II secretion system protein n=1 Tax=Shewanella woodyi TaxID=60961 RepID=UPI0007EB163D|nr:prepilin-type N-terminal cleavage/methylation domain-containing protein [Shewanella woodyi]